MHDDTDTGWKLNDVVRYGPNGMDIMQITAIDDVDGEVIVTGAHIVIGTRSAKVEDLHAPTQNEMMIWTAGERFRAAIETAGLTPGQTWRDTFPDYEPSPMAHIPRACRAGG